jgi:hypothetical protein
MSDAAREDDLSHLYALFYGTLSICGCGNPEDAYALVRDVLALTPFHDNGGWRKARDLIGSNGAYHLVLSQLDEAKLLEHGSSIGGSWLTGKGKHYLALMQRYTWDDVEDTGFPHDGGECPPSCVHALAVAAL